MTTKVSYCFVWDKANRMEMFMLCQKGSSAPLLDPSRNKNNKVCRYVNLKNNIEEFQRSEVLLPVGIARRCWNYPKFKDRKSKIAH